MKRREHQRVRLRLPVRLRWSTPLGQKTEVGQTRNASRGGLLLVCHERHGIGFPLWVTFPFDASAPDIQSEILARVVRQEHVYEDGKQMPAMAVHFESTPRTPSNGNGHSGYGERRSNPRSQLSLPVRIRTSYMPWFEEAMTLDVSAESLRFLSNRVYQPGDSLFISFDPPTSSPWSDAAESPVRIVRVEPTNVGGALQVIVRREASTS